jgi:predicted N-acyltransferase
MRAAIHPSIEEFDARAWNALETTNNPFLRHEFLALLERTHCVGAEAGWQPAYVALHDGAQLAAAAPAYVKSHSYGEFVFDFSWAQAYARFGLAYYPKLVIGVPFTPVNGPRLLVGANPQGRSRKALIAALEQLAMESHWSSVHALFPLAPDTEAFTSAGWLTRRDVQFHWHNQNYCDFDDFLATFTADKRKKAKRERRRVAEQGVTFETLLGPDIPLNILDTAYLFHRQTFLRHGHEPYLTREFFRAVPAALGEHFMLKVAWHANIPVAIAVFFWHADALYGRYWGAADNFHSLHFETCYHQGVEFCIERGIARFEPGTQGEHKVSRGFEPSITHSAHWISDARFRNAIADYVTREGAQVDAYADAIRTHVPYRDARRIARAAAPDTAED